MNANHSELWIVRHGETEWSREGRHTSRTDLPLTSAGEEAAAALSQRLAETEFALVLSSPRERARRTAALAGFPHADVDEDLVEWDYGDFEGLTTAAIRETVPGWTIWSHPCPGGESEDAIGDRLDRVVEKVRAQTGPVLAFTHGHAGRALAMRWLGLRPDGGRLLRLDPATISVLGYERESPVVARWNN